MSHKAGPEPYGEEIHESAEEKANRVIKEELKKLGWREKELMEVRRSFLRPMVSVVNIWLTVNTPPGLKSLKAFIFIGFIRL